MELAENSISLVVADYKPKNYNEKPLQTWGLRGLKVAI
jgi:hypothetical protein